MNRKIRIGLIAEGETELGASIPYIKPEDGGKVIDRNTVAKILGVELDNLKNLEDLDDTKNILEEAIAQSTYLLENISNQRPFKIRWNLAAQIDLVILKNCCPNGYAAFAKNLITSANVVAELTS